MYVFIFNASDLGTPYWSHCTETGEPSHVLITAREVTERDSIYSPHHRLRIQVAENRIGDHDTLHVDLIHAPHLCFVREPDRYAHGLHNDISRRPDLLTQRPRLDHHH